MLPRRYLAPSHWLGLPSRLRERRRLRRLRRQADEALAAMPPVGDPTAARIVLLEGMYNSPNHFFRLRVFLDALARTESFRLVGVLRHSGERDARRSLEALGVSEFLVLDEGDVAEIDVADTARRMLADVRTHADLLSLELPHGLPAHVFYDTVLKETRDPQPPLSSPLWERYLRQALMYLAVYADFFDRNEVAHAPFSHPWKNEYGIGFWMALQRGAAAYHLTAYFETLRILRFRDIGDYPYRKEKMGYAEFRGLPPRLQDEFRRRGRDYLVDRIEGDTTDINGSRAYNPQARELDRSRARRALGIDGDRKAVLVCAHAWYDFPHHQDMRNFTDFKDWITCTLETIRDVTDVIWVLKPHPLEGWYGAFRLQDVLGEAPEHIRVLPEDTDSATGLAAADAVVTVFGTIGLEAAARRLPVIAADRSYYSDWRLTHEAWDRDDYARLLRDAATLERPSPEKADDAAAFAYLALAPHPASAGLLELVCDSRGSEVPQFVTRELSAEEPIAFHREIDRVANWLQAGSRSYSVDIKLNELLDRTSSARMTA